MFLEIFRFYHCHNGDCWGGYMYFKMTPREYFSHKINTFCIWNLFNNTVASIYWHFAKLYFAWLWNCTVLKCSGPIDNNGKFEVLLKIPWKSSEQISPHEEKRLSSKSLNYLFPARRQILWSRSWVCPVVQACHTEKFVHFLAIFRLIPKISQF